MSTPTSLEDLIAEVKALKAEDLISVFRGLGMSRIGDDHTYDCPSSAGNRCNCVPPEPTWTQPKVLTVHFGETYEELAAKARKRREE